MCIVFRHQLFNWLYLYCSTTNNTFFKTYSMFYVLYKLCRSTTWGIGNFCRFIYIHMKQFGLLAPKDFKYIMTLSVPNVDYSRNASYVLIWISTFVLIHSTTDYLIFKENSFLIGHNLDIAVFVFNLVFIVFKMVLVKYCIVVNKGNNKLTELRTILQRESQNS